MSTAFLIGFGKRFLKIAVIFLSLLILRSFSLIKLTLAILINSQCTLQVWLGIIFHEMCLIILSEQKGLRPFLFFINLNTWYLVFIYIFTRLYME